MERPHYRRVTGSEAPKAEADHGDGAARSTFSERLVAQFIVCGAIMALILVLNLFNTPLTHGIKGVIQDQTTMDDVRQAISDASGTVKSIFGNTINHTDVNSFDIASGTPAAAAEKSDSPTPQPAQTDAPSDGPAVSPAPSASSAPSAPADFRIDEDILTQIQADSAGQ